MPSLVEKPPTVRCPECGYWWPSEDPAALCESCQAAPPPTPATLEPCDDYDDADDALSLGPDEPRPPSPQERARAAGSSEAVHPTLRHACVLCRHPAHEAIAAALQDGIPFSRLLQHYGGSRSSWSTHRRHCLGMAPLTSQERGAKSVRYRAPRAVVCCICRHVDRAAIDALIQQGASMANLARQYNISDQSFAKHRSRCLGVPAPKRNGASPPGPPSFAGLIAARLAALNDEIAALSAAAQTETIGQALHVRQEQARALQTFLSLTQQESARRGTHGHQK